MLSDLRKVFWYPGVQENQSVTNQLPYMLITWPYARSSLVQLRKCSVLSSLSSCVGGSSNDLFALNYVFDLSVFGHCIDLNIPHYPKWTSPQTLIRGVTCKFPQMAISPNLDWLIGLITCTGYARVTGGAGPAWPMCMRELLEELSDLARCCQS